MSAKELLLAIKATGPPSSEASQLPEVSGIHLLSTVMVLRHGAHIKVQAHGQTHRFSVETPGRVNYALKQAPDGDWRLVGEEDYTPLLGLEMPCPGFVYCYFDNVSAAYRWLASKSQET